MPLRHGLLVREQGKEPVLVFGIMEIVDAVSIYPFRSKPEVDVIFDPVSRFGDHFDQTIKDRLMLVIPDLCIHLQKYAECMAKFRDPVFRKRIQCHTEHSGMTTEALFYYWNILIDDLSRIIPYVFEKEPKMNPDKMDFSKLRGMIVKAGYLPVLKSLFEPLSDPKSWWFKCFSPMHGIRQRFTHFPDAFSLNAHFEGNITYPAPSLWVFSNDRVDVQTDLDEGIFYMLQHFFNWLDALEKVLREELRCRAKREGILWNEKKQCPELQFPCCIVADDEAYLIPRVESSIWHPLNQKDLQKKDEPTQKPSDPSKWWSVEKWLN